MNETRTLETAIAARDADDLVARTKPVAPPKLRAIPPAEADKAEADRIAMAIRGMERCFKRAAREGRIEKRKHADMTSWLAEAKKHGADAVEIRKQFRQAPTANAVLVNAARPIAEKMARILDVDDTDALAFTLGTWPLTDARKRAHLAEVKRGALDGRRNQAQKAFWMTVEKFAVLGLAMADRDGVQRIIEAGRDE